jgi:hypothetical protein
MKDGVPNGSLAGSAPAACSGGGRLLRGIEQDSLTPEICSTVIETVL